MEFFLKKPLCLAALATMAGASSLWGQPTVRFPQTSPPNIQAGSSLQQGAGAPVAGASSSTLGAPFDPYSSSFGSAPAPPAFGGPTSPSGVAAPPAPSATPPPGAVAPYPGSPPPAPYANPYTPPAPYAQPYGGYAPGVAPGTTPPALFPNGWSMNSWTGPGVQFLTPRLRHTYVDGGGAADDLGIHDTDVSVAAAFPNFLYSNEPLYVVPSFSLHLWQGPQAPNGDLPASAYSAFLDTSWSTDPERPLGGEVGVRVGIFSDFNTFNTDSLRVMGQGLFRLRATPTTVLRGGVAYINRNRFKLFPAFGLLWTPNSQTRFDIFFPSPKLAQRLTTLGTQDVWWYVAGEYGGGAWTVERAGGFSDRIDINDIRLILGLEWGQAALLQQGRRTAFVEAGWVTDREVVYVRTPAETSSLRDSFMIRAGWNY